MVAITTSVLSRERCYTVISKARTASRAGIDILVNEVVAKAVQTLREFIEVGSRQEQSIRHLAYTAIGDALHRRYTHMMKELYKRALIPLSLEELNKVATSPTAEAERSSAHIKFAAYEMAFFLDEKDKIRQSLKRKASSLVCCDPFLDGMIAIATED